MSDAVPASVREELDQTPEWWDRQFQALLRARIPRDAANHEGHDLVEEGSYASTVIRRWCVDCGVELDPYDEGSGRG